MSKYIVRCRRPPSQTWRTFLDNHLTLLVTIDFFIVPTIRFQVLYVFLVLAHERRRIVHCNVTAHPTAQWTGQQLREALPFDQSPRYLLRDRDAIFGDEFRDQVRDLVFAAGETIIGLPHRLLRSPRLLHPILFTKIEFSIGTDELVTKFLVEFVARFCNIERI